MSFLKGYSRVSSVLIITLVLLSASAAFPQVSPIGGLGSIQMFDNNGNPATSGCFYFFQAGTSTQIATFTDSTGTVQNTNPLCVGAGARAIAWLTTSAFYKVVACVSNDGASCNGGDILWQQDNLPGGVTGGGGGGGSPFISASANPATSGILRLASGDSVCWRNTANSSNLCFSKDTSDLLSWAGGSEKFPEVGAPTGVAGFDILYADSTAHRWKMLNNGGSAVQVVASGNDISTSDGVTQLHFGATATPLSGTAPTTGQFLQWNGTNIIGAVGTAEVVVLASSANSVACAAGVQACPVFIVANAHTLTRFVANTSQAPVGCGTNGTWGVKDLTSSTVLASATPTVTGVLDSGALSVAMPAGHQFTIGLITTPTGCSTFPVSMVSATYQQ